LVVPRRVDHDERRRQITDAVARITVRGGLGSATMREVAAEAGVSLRLVQYYFGTKDQLLLTTLEHAGERATARLMARMAEAGEDPRAVLRAILTSFVPADDERREAMLLFVALHTASLTDPTLAREEAHAVPQALVVTLARHLRRAEPVPGVDPDLEAQGLAATVVGLAQAVLDGGTSPEEAERVVDYVLDRALQPVHSSMATEIAGPGGGSATYWS
jgi:AcrR family transcriptional regulator